MSMTVTTTESGSYARFRWTVAAVTWSDEVGPMVRTELKHRAPVGKRTPRPGRYRDSIRYSRRTLAGVGVKIDFTANTPYAPYVTDGTRPHEISAVAARALHWTDGSGGHFAKVVQHPGTKPNPFAREAVRHMEPVIRASFKRAVRDAMR